jgi:hypothetical protein
MMSGMRTTLTLDPDVAKLLEEEVHRQRKPTKQVVNEALRRGLLGSAPRKAKLRVQPHSTKLRPGVDAGKLNALVDELEDDAAIASFRS